MVLYRPSRIPFQAPFLAPFFLVLSLEDLSAFMETERSDWASVTERREARRELLELGISFRGDSCAEAVSEGNLHGVELFIRAGFPPDTRDKKGVPILCLAARTGHGGILNLLLTAGASINMQSEDRGNTALMDAAAGGNLQIVEDLLALGADVSIKSKNGQSALIISVGKNDLSISKLLLDAGGDPDDQDKLGFTARKYATLFHNPAMVALFEKKPR
jgi:ankyrin repeat protein